MAALGFGFGRLTDLAYNLGGLVGPNELARIKAENEAMQRKALERRGVGRAEADAYILESNAQIDRDLKKQSAHPSDSAHFGAFDLTGDSVAMLSRVVVGAAVVGIAYFLFQFFKAVRGK